MRKKERESEQTREPAIIEFAVQNTAKGLFAYVTSSYEKIAERNDRLYDSNPPFTLNKVGERGGNEEKRGGANRRRRNHFAIIRVKYLFSPRIYLFIYSKPIPGLETLER